MMQKTQQNFTTMQYFSSTALRSIQTIKKTGLLLIAAQAFVLSVQAFDHDQSDAAASTTTTTSSSMTQAPNSDAEIVSVAERTTNMNPVFAPVLSMPNELLLRLTDFMDLATLRSFQMFVNIAEIRYHTDNNHKDQHGNIQENGLLQQDAIIGHRHLAAHEFIKDHFGAAAAHILTLLDNFLKMDFRKYSPLIESLISPQNQEIIRSLEIANKLTQTPPSAQLFITAHAHQLFTGMNSAYTGLLITHFVQFFHSNSFEAFETLIIHVPQLFTANMNVLDRGLITRKFYMQSPVRIETFCQGILAHAHQLFTPNMEGWEMANIINEFVIADSSDHDISAVAEQFTETMTFQERLQIIRNAHRAGAFPEVQ